MIVAQEKPLEEIKAMIEPYDKILILGCNSCVTVCMVGGAKEVEILTETLLLDEEKKHFIQHTVERQCDKEFIIDEETKKIISNVDAVISLACGAGVQLLAEAYREKDIFPGVNTTFLGTTEEQGKWLERCLGCGNCRLARFGGICPLSRCAKSLQNGPCGGSVNGKCEVDPENLECGWQLIYDVLSQKGQLDLLENIEPLNDWRTSYNGGPRQRIREDMFL